MIATIDQIRALGAVIMVLGLTTLYLMFRTPRAKKEHGVLDFDCPESRAALRRIHGRQR